MTSRLFFVLTLLFASLFAGALPRVTDTSVNKNGVTLKLSKPLLSTPKKASIPTADPSKNRFYADFNAVLTKPALFSKNGVFPEVRIAQFDKETVRVAIVADKKSSFVIAEGDGYVSFKLDGALKEEKKDNGADKKAERQKQENQKEGSANEPSKIERPKQESLKTDPFKVEPKEDAPLALLGSKKKRIVIDPGHGGKDPGATGEGGVTEKSLVLSVSKTLADMLEKKGYTVHLTRYDDTFIELKDRTSFANKKNADLFISVHANAIDVKRSDLDKFQGIETYFLSPARSERAKKAAEKENGVAMMNEVSKQTFLNFLNHEKIIASNKLAIDIQRGLLSYARSKHKETVDGGVKEAPFWVLVGAQMPAVLVELGYLTHDTDLARLKDERYRALLAKGIMEGIEAYFQNN